MPIQFPCQICQRLIEVDDELARAQVACPFCKATVTAPAQSQLPVHAPPVARSAQIELATPGPAPIGTQPATLPHAQPAHLDRNTLGISALVVALLAWAFFGAILAYALVQVTGILIDRGIEQPTPDNVRDAVDTLAEDPDSTGVVKGLGLAMSASALVAVVLSIVALRRPGTRKGTAIAGLILGGTLTMCSIFANL